MNKDGKKMMDSLFGILEANYLDSEYDKMIENILLNIPCEFDSLVLVFSS